MRRNDFPLTDSAFAHQFGIRAVPEGESIVWVTEFCDAELGVKNRLLDEAPDRFFAARHDSLASQREAFELLVAASPIGHSLATKQIEQSIEASDSPLLFAGRRVQEDLVVIKNDQENGYPVIAGCVCFPAGWSIEEKLNRSFASVHAPVPQFDKQLLSPSIRLFQSLKAGRSVWRTNWGVRASDRLDQLPVDVPMFESLAAQVNRESAARCVMRVEYQTLSRLPTTQDILFTIHTRQTRLSDLSCGQRQTLAGVIATCPEATLRYKGILPMRDAVVGYLSKKE